MQPISQSTSMAPGAPLATQAAPAPAELEGLHRIEGQTFRDYLRMLLVERCDRNPRYSLRAFARSLAVDPSTLVKLLAGTRPIGRRLIEKLGLRLALDPGQVRAFVAVYEQNRTVQHRRGQSGKITTPSVAELRYETLSLDTFKVISDWYHYALLELMRTTHFRQDVAWIAQALGINVHQVKSAVERLHRVGMLVTLTDGRWHEPGEGQSTTVGNAFTHAAFRHLQRSVLEKALVALEDVPFEARDQSSMTMAIDSTRLPEARERIKAFRRELDAFLTGGEKRDRVYHLSVSLYPVSSEASDAG